MSIANLNENQIVDAIANMKDVGGIAKTSAMELVEHFIENYGQLDILSTETLAVERPFYLWLDERTLAVGVMDKISRMKDTKVIFGCEWKTTRPPSGRWWTEEKWLKEIGNECQLGLYALAMRDGTFIGRNGDEDLTFELSHDPVVLTRAAVKSHPPQFWPTDTESGIFQFDKERLQTVRDSFLNRATSIRCLRNGKVRPWQFTGRHCFNHFGSDCPFLLNCQKGDNKTVGGHGTIQNGDPAWPSIEAAGVDPKKMHSELVILSASAYSLGNMCMEKYRLIVDGAVQGDSSLALQIGSAFHEGIAAFYKQHLTGAIGLEE